MSCSLGIRYACISSSHLNIVATYVQCALFCTRNADKVGSLRMDLDITTDLIHFVPEPGSYEAASLAPSTAIASSTATTSTSAIEAVFPVQVHVE